MDLPKRLPLLENFLTETKEEIGTDTASFLIVDPAYIKTEDLEGYDSLMDKIMDMEGGGKDGKYNFSGVQGDGLLITTGADGSYEVDMEYEGEDSPNIPKSATLKIKESAIPKILEHVI